MDPEDRLLRLGAVHSYAVQVLKGLSWEICLVYLNDIIVFETSFEEPPQEFGASGHEFSPKKMSTVPD